MGTACLLPTRRYHALLTVARRPPVDRRVLLAGLEEQVESPEAGLLRLDASQWGTAEAPGGEAHLVEFSPTPYPRFRYRFGGHLLERFLVVPRGSPAVLVGYRHLEGPGDLDLLVSPLLAGRCFHDLILANELADPDALSRDGDLVFRPYPEEPALHLRESGWQYHPDPSWVEGMVYERERARGYQYQEDLLRPGHLEFSLAPGDEHLLAFSAGPLGAEPGELLRRERQRREALERAERGKGPHAPALALATDRFLVTREEGGPSVIAGYPWFEDWGRDTFLSLPGIAPEPGSPLAAKILATFAAHRSQGLIPNRFGDRPGETSFNAADASLWFMVEYERLLRGARPDPAVDALLWEAARSIFLHYLEGTRFGIGVDPRDGLLAAEAPGLQLTWMDAKVDDLVVTPRSGKPVELQGLWYSCCRVVAEQARSRGEDELAGRAEAASEAVEASFHRSFWISSCGYYGDCIPPDGPLDRSLRPNQVLVLGLRHRLAPPEAGRQVLEVVDRELLTPYGLRTLAPGDPAYRGRYQGPLLERDLAYHQGTVWPWLLGPYGQACLQYRGAGDRSRLLEVLQPLLGYLTGDGLGNLAEVYDGDAPHAPGGCPAQAWSAAQVRSLYLQVVDPDPYDPLEI